MIRKTLAFFLLVLCAPLLVHAQDTLIVVEIGDVNVKLGDTALIPITVLAPVDSIAGFTISMVLGRPSLVEFRNEYAVERAGSLTSAWEIVTGNEVGTTSLRITGLPDGDPLDGTPGPLPPITTPQILVYAVGFIPCVRDPFGDNDVQINGNIVLTQFSDPQGQLIEPVAIHDGIVTIRPPTLGDLDQSGELNIADVVAVIGCAFRSSCPVCGSLLADLNCSGAVDVVDVVMQVNYVFRAGNQPFCF